MMQHSQRASRIDVSQVLAARLLIPLTLAGDKITLLIQSARKGGEPFPLQSL